jgi:hypothetical protein
MKDVSVYLVVVVGVETKPTRRTIKNPRKRSTFHFFDPGFIIYPVSSLALVQRSFVSMAT